MRAVITGGAGFIGSNLTDRLLADGHTVTVIDNFSGGNRSFLASQSKNPRFNLIELDLRQTEKLTDALPTKTAVVFHLAANSDISRGAVDPTIDFENTVKATFSLLQAMKTKKVKKIVFTSGSGVYGDRGSHYSKETDGPLLPVSMYGSAKLSAEALISAFVHLHSMQAWILRPANIIGPRLTHGVVYDFIGRLKTDPTKLRVLGDGHQSKSYLYVQDVVDALLFILENAKDQINIFNLASTNFITVNEIAAEVIGQLKLSQVKLEHTGGTVGWKGDVAIVRLNNQKLKHLGWQPRFTSKKAVKQTIAALLKDQRFSSL